MISIEPCCWRRTWRC